MGAGTYSKIKTVIAAETITASDRNAEHDNHISNQNFAGLDDYSATVPEMKVTADPFASSTESQATSGQGEIERLRYQIDRIGEALRGTSDFTEWYHDMPTAGIFRIDNANVQAIFTLDGTASPHFKIVSNDATTDLLLDNTATDGDPSLQWGLSGTVVASMGVDDGDSDKLKIGSTAIGTETVLEIIPTAAPHVKVISGDATTALWIDNTATDGDPILSFGLSGTAIFTMGVDDGDGDAFKIGTTAIATNTAFEIPAVGSQLQVAAGTVSLPGLSTPGDPDTGLYFPTGDQIAMGLNGSRILNISATDGLTIDTSGIAIPEGLLTKCAIRSRDNQDSGLYFTGSGDNVQIAANGTRMVFFAAAQINFGTSTWATELSSTGHFPSTTNTIPSGKTGQLWTDVWATSGSVNTSHSTTKYDIKPLEDIPLPPAVRFKRKDDAKFRKGKEYIGYLNDSLPDAARAITEDGSLDEKGNYSNAVVGILIAHVDKLEKEMKQIKEPK